MRSNCAVCHAHFTILIPPTASASASDLKCLEWMCVHRSLSCCRGYDVKEVVTMDVVQTNNASLNFPTSLQRNIVVQNARLCRMISRECSLDNIFTKKEFILLVSIKHGVRMPNEYIIPSATSFSLTTFYPHMYCMSQYPCTNPMPITSETALASHIDHHSHRTSPPAKSIHTQHPTSHTLRL